MTKQNNPNPAVIGGFSENPSQKQRMEVPVGLEQLLFMAARDSAFKERLLADRKGALKQKGIQLRPIEERTLNAISDDSLKTMTDRIRPDNPKRRKVMRIVAATVASLAAGTAFLDCSRSSGGVQPGTEIDYEPDSEINADADTGKDTDEDTNDTDSHQP